MYQKYCYLILWLKKPFNASYNKGVYNVRCIMGNQGIMAGNSKVCMEIRSKLTLSKLYICDFRFRKTFFISQSERCDTQNLDCIEVLYLSIFYEMRYILCKLAIQKNTGNVWGNMFASKMSNNGHGV